ncbi:hypothetical protein [Komagataeibacter sp. FNDCR2]|uniref:hypothetical protein n=1 Tax=Komagataeibacter sp. FNDCR2 TaxID=2878682 RepID=UPI001E2A95EB|nr:hypothetical protein [Komagataeibacter sp. FNDCR2]MCE2576647.1 hypothetical protein [Komagataeibacter sp. FNDCR2]
MIIILTSEDGPVTITPGASNASVICLPDTPGNIAVPATTTIQKHDPVRSPRRKSVSPPPMGTSVRIGICVAGLCLIMFTFGRMVFSGHGPVSQDTRIAALASLPEREYRVQGGDVQAPRSVAPPVAQAGSPAAAPASVNASFGLQ